MIGNAPSLRSNKDRRDLSCLRFQVSITLQLGENQRHYRCLSLDSQHNATHHVRKSKSGMLVSKHGLLSRRRFSFRRANPEAQPEVPLKTPPPGEVRRLEEEDEVVGTVDRAKERGRRRRLS